MSAASVVSATPDHALVNQYRRNVNIAGETVDQNRVVLTLVPDRGQWKLVHATVI
ncbi:MAG TPA: hypothetical protein VFC19_34955 [Candidatus Limnocylindrales bacterium]|nr:hypothetical protein [Candidatus Limnocylindrales bacterium]